FDLFFDRNRLATFVAIFLGAGVLFTVTVLIGLYVQELMGYSALRAGVCFIPFTIAFGIGLGLSSQLVTRFSPRVVVISGGVLVFGAMLYGSTLDRSMPYFPTLVVLITLGGIGIGMTIVPLALAAITDVGFDRIGPTSAIVMMLQNLGGTNGPVKYMNAAQLHALDHGYTYSLIWVAGVALLTGGVALLIGYSAQ